MSSTHNPTNEGRTSARRDWYVKLQTEAEKVNIHPPSPLNESISPLGRPITLFYPSPRTKSYIPTRQLAFPSLNESMPLKKVSAQTNASAQSDNRQRGPHESPRGLLVTSGNNSTPPVATVPKHVTLAFSPHLNSNKWRSIPARNFRWKRNSWNVSER